MTCGSPNQTLCLIGTSMQKTEQCVLEMSWQRLEECGNKLFPHQHWSGGVGVGGAEGLGVDLSGRGRHACAKGYLGSPSIIVLKICIFLVHFFDL